MSLCHSSYLILLVAVNLATSGHGANLCQQDQSSSLLRLKSSFNFFLAASNLSSWIANTDCCTWEGVTCDGATGHVTSLDLSDLEIIGNLNSDIFNLTSLRFLSLANNCFKGSPWLSRGFEQLPHLQYLNLSSSCLSGYIPVENGQLSNLVTLDLSMSFDLQNLGLDTLIDNLGSLQKLYLNYVNILVSPTRLAHAASTNTTSHIRELSMQSSTINGRIDTALSRLRFLSKLTLDFSVFNSSAPVPESFAELSSLDLVVLSLQSCGLTGTFPSRILHIKSLEVLDVSYNWNLYGELPEFMQDSALEHLIVSNTKFSGKIPASIGNLHNLSTLNFDSCKFHGRIPSFSQWPKIQIIDLARNNLTGSLNQDGYLSLQNLTTLRLSGNSISGEIPASLFSHPSLQYIDLSKNKFTGNFLLYPNASSGLKKIFLSENKLQGPITKLLSKLVGLEELDLSSNSLTGIMNLSLIKNYKNLTRLLLANNRLSIIEEYDNHPYTEYPSLETLRLASCNLTNVPKFLMHQKGISVLDLSNNHIVGHIPDWIWGTGEYLSYVNLSHNLFTSVQTNLSNVSTHYGITLDLSSNKISGALPIPPLVDGQLDYSNNHFNSSVTAEFWSQVINGWFLSLSNNSLIGEVPHSICNMIYIQVLDLSFNNFSGMLPPCLLQDKNLTILNLRGNNFHGSLPQKIREECTLTAVDLNGNKLDGKLPRSLVNCHMLQILDLGNNKIEDTFPEWLGVLPVLKVLVLRSNGFYGHIDPHYGKDKQTHSIFSALQVLDLSSNEFIGSIPKEFLKKLKAMMVESSLPPTPSAQDDTIAQFMFTYYSYMDLVTVMQKGLELTVVNILSIFRTLDLSNNNFDGIIIDEIGNLNLLQGLNLSRNSFTGRIPPLGNMLQLESLDLSYNQLSGKIPTVMTELSFLEVLNLSYNHLSGPIPQSNQFLTFQETSFLGNDGLCGKPLPQPCDTNHIPPAPVTPSASEGVNWDVLSIEGGVIWGLAIVIGATLLWSNGRRWAYWHVDRFLLCVLQPWIGHRHH